MTRHLTLCATGALLLGLSACGPQTPDPAPVVPPENVEAAALLETPSDSMAAARPADHGQGHGPALVWL